MSEPVELTEVGTEMEAAELCGYLGESGIEAHYSGGGGSVSMLGSEAGAQRVWVRPADLERARELLDQAR